MRLPELDGWKVLDLLKHDPATRHIPVHIISVADQRQRALELGAIAHLTKPVERQALAEALDRLIGFVDRQLRRLLVVEDDEVAARGDRRADRQRRRRDDGRRDRRRGAGGARPSSGSTAWCSTWACRT